ncbi:hypothetical protein TWF481_003360 [Arthrobotrys musiformis]|uniref:Uncharacterized protein n=1 Tax=Arthrobotrys musiformis TaxID=47236 RepID=A0AAV9VSK5_9PEZI
MSSSGNTTPRAGNSIVPSPGRERLPQSPNLEPLQLPNPQIPPEFPTTAETIRRIFQDTTLSHQDQDGLVESILAFIRINKEDPIDIYGTDSSDDEFDDILVGWVGKAMDEFSIHDSAARAELAARDAAQVEVPGAKQAGRDENKKRLKAVQKDEVIDAQDEDGDTLVANRYLGTRLNIDTEGDDNAESESDEVSEEKFDLSLEEEYHFMLREGEEIQAEIAWYHTRGRDILPEHFALFKRCITERIRYCVGEEKEVLDQALSESQIAWLAEPIPENSTIKVPEKEKVWIVVWSVMKFARMLLLAGGGPVRDNKHINEYVAIMIGIWWLVRCDPFDYVNKAQKGGPEVYMSVEGWITTKEPWATTMLKESLGGSFQQVCERTKARKGGDGSPVKPSSLEVKDEEDLADFISAREDFIKSLLEEALEKTTHKLSGWSKYTERRRQKARARQSGAETQDPAGAV